MVPVTPWHISRTKDGSGVGCDITLDVKPSRRCLVVRWVMQMVCPCSVIDYGAGWFDLNWAFSQQRAMNPPGKSPPMCSEF